jgi:hypothetical protein
MPLRLCADSRILAERNIRVLHTAGMGFLDERWKKVTLKRFDVSPHRDGTVLFGSGRRRAFSTAEGGRLEAAVEKLDEGLNVHGFFAWCAAGRARAACADWATPSARRAVAREGTFWRDAGNVWPAWQGRVR